MPGLVPGTFFPALKKITGTSPAMMRFGAGRIDVGVKS
jgi:hypothetical protein